MIKTNPISLQAIYDHLKSMLLYHAHGIGLLALVAVLFILSILAGFPLEKTPKIFLAGEIAEVDVIANRAIMIEDTEATQLRYEQIRAEQPLIFDMAREKAIHAKDNILKLLQTLNTYSFKTPHIVHEKKNTEVKDVSKLTKVIENINKTYGTNLTALTFGIISNLKVQHYTFDNLLPWINNYLLLGIIDDMRLLDANQESIIIRNQKTNSQIIRSLETGIMDIRELTVALGNKIRSDNFIDNESQRVLIDILPKFLLPTLVMNKKASDARIEEVLSATEPVFYYIKQGEVILRAGDKADRITQLKMEELFGESQSEFNFPYSLGIFLLGSILGFGLLMPPSGVKGRILHTKDQLFMSLILLITGLSAAFFANYFSCIQSNAGMEIIPFAFPVPGIAGLAVLIFSARRYCVFGLLVSFFTTTLFQGGIDLFLFYFVISMISTFLILRTQSRQHVVWCTIPLTIALFFVGFITAMIYELETELYSRLIFILLTNSILSILILFALSPILEMLFGYTTRFRLMELLSLDHPLLQELMVKVPGTYHHSLVVSNLVETAAKSINANSLLVKVGALYHDIGKLSRPDYFSENQFNGVNPHDNLSPAMSTLILFAHVKYGTELALEHKLGSEILDMIQQHHGTRTPQYFYQKALKLGENPKEADYQYPGPRPQSKEAAILMIADTVEAAIRSMGSPSPARIQTSIETLIKNIYAEGQLDETDLTFKDLNNLIESFTRAVTGIYHQRISYTEAKKTLTKRDEDKYQENQDKKALSKDDETNNNQDSTK